MYYFYELIVIIIILANSASSFTDNEIYMNIIRVPLILTIIIKFILLFIEALNIFLFLIGSNILTNSP